MIDLHTIRQGESLELPLDEAGVTAGFLTPADTAEWETIDFNREFVRNPETTFCGRVRGDSMIHDGIHDGDIVIIDRLEEWKSGDVVVACVSGEFTLKRIEIRGEEIVLVPANPEFPEIVVEPGDTLRIWGVVTYVVHRLHKR